MEGFESDDSNDGRESPVGGVKRTRKCASSGEDDYFPPTFNKVDKIGFGWDPSSERKKKKKKKNKKADRELSRMQAETQGLKKHKLGPKKAAKREHKKEAKEIELKDMTLPDCLRVLRNERPGSNAFMRVFVKIEKEFFGSNNQTVIVRVTDVDSKNLEKYFLHEHKVIVTSNAAALGYRGPPNFSFEKAKEIFQKSAKELEVIDSRAGETVRLPIRHVLDHIENGIRDENSPIFNVLSLEVSNDSQLAPLIEVPTFVKEQSLVLDAERTLKSEARMDNWKKNVLSGEEMNERRCREEKLAKFNQHIPRYEKYIIFSQAGAYTDLHIDLAGSGVFYYVHTGQKIIYFAEPTEENLKLYTQLEMQKKNLWSCDESILRRFQRIEVNAGEMVLIPPGFLHMVYTPIDSLVFGGNFLTETFLPLHFKMVVLEETCQKMKHLSKTQMFKEFDEFMFLYLEKNYLKLMLASEHSRNYPHLMARGRVLLENLEHRVRPGHIYNRYEKQDLLEELRNLLGMTKSQKINEAMVGIEKMDYSIIKNIAPLPTVGYTRELQLNI
ncbi:hypothetical protein CAEBREN_04858 [Caenorhabditis brenneri]|uniref:JmjC domain-containing protein n=1 Tax=Caenorhabditis brenneri TaxID=135651 RepID=G0MHV1_CAEBE|nr:hypothetical protein CAEBREN_04858 [Caenorhabditis brenneri]